MDTPPMQQVLEHLLEATAPDPGQNAAIAAQITFTTGLTVRGSVARGPIAGTYRMLTEGRMEQNGRQLVAPTEMYFAGASIFAIMVMKDLSALAGGVSPLVRPPS